jgi:ABC-type polysaccharide/polyol phosphate export permease
MAGTSDKQMTGIPAVVATDVPFREPVQSRQQPRLSLLQDVQAGIRTWHAWTFKGWYDIVLRYRRTLLGPVWMVITTGVMIACLSVLGPALFGGGDPKFIPYMVSGIISWNFLSLGIIEGCNAFIEHSNDIRSVRMPYSIYVFQVIFRDIIVYGHLLVIYVVVLILNAGNIVPNLGLFLVGLFLVCLWLTAMSFLTSLVCARFRDLQQLLTSLMTVAFLLTPVFWDKTILLGSSRGLVVELNPLYHYLDVIRSPLLGQVPTLSTYAFAVIGIVVTFFLAELLYRASIRRVPFWL